jgi:hypothetical protein
MWNASIDADGVVACLEHLAERGAPAYVRFDHGPEFIAYAVADWCRFNGTDTVFIDPGSPWQNTWIESFNGRLRAKFLNRQQFATLLEDWRIDYNINRPHTAGSPPSSSSRLGSAGNSSHSHGEWINYRGPLISSISQAKRYSVARSRMYSFSVPTAYCASTEAERAVRGQGSRLGPGSPDKVPTYAPR